MRTSYWCTHQRHCADAGTGVTGGRTSGIVECWDPRYWCSYQRRCVNAGPKGSKQERAPPRRATNPKTGGRRPEERSSSQVTPQLFFNTAGAFKPVSLELYTVLAHVVRRLGLTSIARCPRSWLLSPYHVLTPSPFPSLVARLFGCLALGIPHSSEVANRLGPLPLFLWLPWIWMIFIPYFHRRGGRARTVPRRCTVAHFRPLEFVRRSSHSLWLRVLRHVSVFAPS